MTFPAFLPLVLRTTLLLGLVILMGLAPAQAQDTPRIVIGSSSEPLPVALTEFFGESDPQRTEIGRTMRSVIANNLDRSGLFRVVPQGAYLQTPEQLQSTPRFQDWRTIDAPSLVTGAVRQQADGQLRVEYRLWDVFGGEQQDGQAFLTQPDNWRRIAHIISDRIYKAITGEEGYFDTRVVYIAESGPLTARVKRLAIMDQDGANHKFLTDGSNLVVTPRFSPTSQEITYMAFNGNRSAAVYILDIDTGRNEELGRFDNMSFAPRYAPDGNSVIFSLLDETGNADIYTIDLRTRRTNRLTRGPGTNTSPSYSPDGRQIVFVSTRGGSPQLYVMNADGSGARRISFGSGQYQTPVWSPRNDKIAFTKQEGGSFYIGVMETDGSQERNLASGYLVEGPTWAPNGRVLMYFKEAITRGGQDRESRLYSIDLTGFNERLVPTPGNASDPAWSPLLR